MDILGKARRLESRIARSLDLALAGAVGKSARQPLEVLDAVVERAADQIERGARGKRLFPFNRILVHVVASTASERARLEALTDGPPSLRQRIVERLASAGCEVSELDVRVVPVARARRGWPEPDHQVSFERTAAPAPTIAPAAAPTASAAPRLELSVISGSAERRAYAFCGGRVDVGRRAEVLDQAQRLLRRNHVAFTEDDAPVNRSVSRRHAHIAFVPLSSEYRVRDDGSSRGTAVVRQGRTIRVPQGSRGVRLESGDEIVLGEARLRVKITVRSERSEAS
ncbi:MAG TPA: FHA domain-containing protein [Vicinamibacterales bacterium]|jgi:hypothetical protein|nr:FHA domain-containing protein [Vicinamibacterales bacterium]